ncbi:MAG: lipid A biosynthesis acyltransferase [Bacteroidetes bacterium]|nr:MAG: lipid A biosynthesis acyltransferase [Bacteroidota bacterium]
MPWRRFFAVIPGWFRGCFAHNNFSPMYAFVFGLLYAVSLLPFFVLYGISDVFFVLLYYVFGYRKKVVMSNLLHAFPEKSPQERQVIARKFYRNFCDNWIETIKLISISKAALNKRISGNFSALHQLQAQGLAVQVNLGHFFNWEIMTLHGGINQPLPFLTVYLPQNSKVFNRLLMHIRGRWGNPLLPSTDMARAVIPWRKKQFLLALGADQSPAVPDGGYWLNFLNRPTPFPKGPEKLARSANLAVAMMTTTKPKRGHYHFDYFLVTPSAKALPDGELLRLYVQHLEQNIRLQPELYLWSHRRWKHAWKPEYAHMWVGRETMPNT